MVVFASSTLVFGGEALVVASALLVVGYLIARAAGTLLGADLDGVHYAGLALFGLAFLILVLMLAQIATGGAVFSHPLVVRAAALGVAVATLVVLLLRRGGRQAAGGKEWAGLGTVCVGAAAVWCSPIFSALPVGYTGDTKYHLISAGQLLDGGSTPTTYVIGNAPNGYPWLFHAVLAFFADLTPGGRAADALSPVMVCLVVGGVASFFALGRELTRCRRGAFFMALFGSMTGGFGFWITQGPALVSARAGTGGSLSSARYTGDFVMVRSYNLAFHNLAPPLPRDLCFALLPCFLLLLLLGMTQSAPALLLGAGITAGLIGVAGGESFFVALGVELGAIVVGDHRRSRLAALLLLPTLGIYSLWAGPMIYNYFQFGGFNDLSDRLVALPPLAILGAWGIVTPLAAYGAWRSFSALRSSVAARLMFVVLVVTGGALVAATISSRFLGPGFQTLGRAHRYWPLLYLALALYAAVGADDLLAGLRVRARFPALVAGGLIVAAAVTSPVLGTMRYPDIVPRDPMLVPTLAGSETVLSALSPHPGGDCKVSVPRPLAQLTAVFTGYRVLFVPGSPVHQGRLRWPNVPGFATFKTRRAFNTRLTDGTPSPALIRRGEKRFGIDAVVEPPGRVRALKGIKTEITPGNYTVLWLERECSSG